MKQNTQSWRKILPGIIISLLALAVIFYIVDVGQLVEALRLADYRFILLLFVSTLGWLLLRAVFWRALLQGKARYWDVFLVLNQGYLLNNLLPFRLGEVGRAFLLSRKARLGFLEVFSTIVIERFLDVAMAAGILLTSLPFVIGGNFARSAAVGAGGLVLLGLGVLYLMARNQLWVERLFGRLAARIPLLERVGGKQVHALLTGLGVLTNGRVFLVAIGLVLLNWGMAIAQWCVLLRAFFPQVRLLWATFVLGVTALGVAVPSSPGSIGVMEASVMGALAVFVDDPSTALAAALTAHLANILITGVLGAYALARDGLSLTGVYRDVRQIPSGDKTPEAMPKQTQKP